MSSTDRYTSGHISPRIGPIMIVAILSLVLVLFAQKPLPVNASQFKACRDSSFCRRYRAWKNLTDRPVLSVASLSSLPIDPAATVLDLVIQLRSSAEESNNYEAVLSLYRTTGAVRLRITETNPYHQRYSVPEGDVVLKPVPSAKPLADSVVRSERAGLTVFEVPRLYRVEVRHSPFQVLLMTLDGRVLQILNSRNLFTFEKFRESGPDSCPAGTSVDMACHPDIDQSGAWAEDFNEFTDPKVQGPSAVGLDVELVTAECLFGLPEHTQPFRLPVPEEPEPGEEPHEEFRFYNSDVYKHALDSKAALYGSIPMVTVAHSSGEFSGFLWLNPSETYVALTRRREAGLNIESTWVSETGIIDVFMFAGPTPAEVLEQYHAVTGLPALPPLFAVGFHQSKWGYEDQTVVEAINAEFDALDVPLDVLWLDIQHTDEKRYLTWNAAYGRPEELLQKLGASGRKLVTIVDPHIKIDPDYFVYAAAKERGVFVKEPDAVTDFVGNCWPGASSYIDFTRPEARELWKQLLSFKSYKGSSPDLFIWNDMNEPSVFGGPEMSMPRGVLHGGGVEHRALHNAFGMYYHRSTFEALLARENPPKRPFVLSRSFFVGSHRYGPIWTGDNQSTWAFLKASVPMLLSLAVSGMSFAGADVGGFEGTPDAELFLRWQQLGALAYPFFRSHACDWTRRREPWAYGPEVLAVVRGAIQLRYALMPYWYTAFGQHALSGKPIIRPLFFEFANDRNTLNDVIATEEELMVGSSILVRGVFEPNQASTEVYLPGSGEKWFDFYDLNAAPLDGGQRVKVPVYLYAIPMFVRAGSILPLKLAKVKSTHGMRKLPTTLRVFPTAAGRATGFLYLDDEESMEYLSGNYVLVRMEYTAETLSLSVESGDRVVDDLVINEVQVVGAMPGHTLMVNGRQHTFTLDSGRGIVLIDTPFKLVDALTPCARPISVHRS